MKTLIIIASVLLFANSVWAGASEDTPAKAATTFASKAYLSTTHKNQLKVIVVKQDTQPVGLTITSSAGNLVYKTSIYELSTLKPIDLSQLDPGSYQVVLKQNAQTARFTVDVL